MIERIVALVTPRGLATLMGVRRALSHDRIPVVRRFAPILVAISGFWTACSPAADNSFRMTRIFSDQAGLVQYLQLEEQSGRDEQHHFGGLTLEVTSRYGIVKRFVFPSDLPRSNTARSHVLIGTLHQGTPDVDFGLPPGFLPTDGATVIFAGADVWDYDVLPANGYTVLYRDNTRSSNRPYFPGPIFQPFTGMPTGLTALIDPVIEYYNQALDHYFITSSQPDIDALDSGRFKGWTRTGESFPAWIAPLDCCFGGSSPPAMGPVCRLQMPPAVGDSHFFSASSVECARTRSQHPEYIVETDAAFWASVPDPQTGACSYDQIPVYRLWNQRIDSNHRYTTSTVIRDRMLKLGYLLEGDGIDPTAMCVGGGIAGE